MRNQGDFTQNLSRIYSVYTGGFVGFVLLLAIFEEIGVSQEIIGYLFVIFTLAVYAGIGIVSRTTLVVEYYVAGRKVPPVYNGMATAADWMSGASFVGMAGTLYILGYDGLAFILGWTGGYVLVAVLIAPYMRKFGAFTVPDFLGARFGGNLPRVMGILILISCSFLYVTAQIFATGIIASRFLGIEFQTAVFVGVLGILLCSMLGGMRGVTWTQVAQYIVLIIAYLFPVVILSIQKTDIPLPQIMYGQILEDISFAEEYLLGNGLAQNIERHSEPFTSNDPLNFFMLAICMMIGTAALPHILMRFFTTPSVKSTRRSVGWALFFISILFITAPAYAAFAKLEIYSNVIGTALSDLPQWVYIYGKLDMIKICGIPATSQDAVIEACRVLGRLDGLLHLEDFTIDRDVIVIATPEIAELPYVIVGLVAAGGLAATLSTADGLLLAIANTLSHDLYFRIIDPKASSRKRLTIARLLLILVALSAAWTASTRPADILSMVAWAFSIAAGGFFPVLFLSIWWKRINIYGACAGMTSGFLIALFYILATRYFDMPLLFGIQNVSAGIFGAVIGFTTIVIVSLMTPPPSRRDLDVLDEMRSPKGTEVYSPSQVR